MTTIILTIIGILLAAAAALMVIFYGGDSFSASDTRARANELINVATNVSSANAIYKAEMGRDAVALTDLTSSDKYLKAPIPAASRFGATTLQLYDQNAFGFRSGISVYPVPGDLCSQVNRSLKQPSQIFPGQGSGAKPVGCIENLYGNGNGFFYSHI